MGVDQDFTIELTEDEFAENGTLLNLGQNAISWKGRNRTFDVKTILNPKTPPDPYIDEVDTLEVDWVWGSLRWTFAGGPPNGPPEPPPSKPGHSITKLLTTSFTFPPDPGGPLPGGPQIGLRRPPVQTRPFYY